MTRPRLRALPGEAARPPPTAPPSRASASPADAPWSALRGQSERAQPPCSRVAGHARDCPPLQRGRREERRRRPAFVSALRGPDDGTPTTFSPVTAAPKNSLPQSHVSTETRMKRSCHISLFRPSRSRGVTHGASRDPGTPRGRAGLRVPAVEPRGRGVGASPCPQGGAGGGAPCPPPRRPSPPRGPPALTSHLALHSCCRYQERTGTSFVLQETWPDSEIKKDRHTF